MRLTEMHGYPSGAPGMATMRCPKTGDRGFVETNCGRCGAVGTVRTKCSACGHDMPVFVPTPQTLAKRTAVIRANRSEVKRLHRDGHLVEDKPEQFCREYDSQELYYAIKRNNWRNA